MSIQDWVGPYRGVEGELSRGDPAPCGCSGVGSVPGSLGEQNELVLTERDFKEEREWD